VKVMSKSEDWKPRGILNRKAGEKNFRLSRHPASPDLDCFIEHYWIVAWDLRGQAPQTQQTLPHPSVHLVFEKDNSRIFGVPTGKFTRLLEGQGRVFGIKFRPGGFYPFVKLPASSFTGKSIEVQEVFGADANAVETALLALEDENQMLVMAENFLRHQSPEPDQNLGLLNRLVDRIIADRAILKVEDVASYFNLSPRTLQRLFSQYVGVSPKWVIQRYRLHEAAEQLAARPVADWSKMAQDLGYFDQAHFIKDFKTVVGTTPAEYARHNEPG
jgi:AraC-like DNA-binding protein